MKTTRVYYKEQLDGHVTVSALINVQDGNVDDDAWNTLIQCVKLMNEVLNEILIWDQGTWDNYVWG